MALIPECNCSQFPYHGGTAVEAGSGWRQGGQTKKNYLSDNGV